MCWSQIILSLLEEVTYLILRSLLLSLSKQVALSSFLLYDLLWWLLWLLLLWLLLVAMVLLCFSWLLVVIMQMLVEFLLGLCPLYPRFLLLYSLNFTSIL